SVERDARFAEQVQAACKRAGCAPVFARVPAMEQLHAPSFSREYDCRRAVVEDRKVWLFSALQCKLTWPREANWATPAAPGPMARRCDRRESRVRGAELPQRQ